MDPSLDANLVNHLDAYVDALRAGSVPDKAALLARHPDIAAILQCLEDLNCLAVAAGVDGEPAPEPAAPGDPATLAWASGPIAPPDSRAAAAPPSQFGKYELLDLLGSGGMGVVYKARQTDLNRVVAVKLLLGNLLASPSLISRFEAEARAAAGLRHPHIIQVYEAGQINGQHYFAMEYIEGHNLAQAMGKLPLPLDEAARCLRDMAGAVAYLHSRGIVHRDLKPSNILLDLARRPYVTDFGLVKLLEVGGGLTHTGDIVGTPSYMAPEQAAGRNQEVGPRSDIYSLGAILYELLTGRPPFKEATPFDTLVQVLEGEPALPRQLNPLVPRPLEMICLKAMAKAPEERYASAELLANDLDRFLREEPVDARPQSRRQRVQRWARQEPGLVSRLAILAVTAAIAQVSFQFGNLAASLAVHSAIMLILGLWALASVAFQTLIRKQRWPEQARKWWLTTDGILLTSLLVVDEAWNSPLVLSYAVYVVASGLWFRVGLVWLTTGIAVAGYAALLLAGACEHALGASPQHHLIVMVALILVGVMVATQVQRVRVLSRYYEHRPLP